MQLPIHWTGSLSQAPILEASKVARQLLAIRAMVSPDQAAEAVSLAEDMDSDQRQVYIHWIATGDSFRQAADKVYAARRSNINLIID